ncbi:MAG: hypothetical protein B6I36_05625 [Desulfobacteraceae bacterium 4572_35.1]|nr:MAG: hypothetical protein B6I36_05625 [Desulfobacteraceae bacterium 4572_35.1]
MEIIAQFEDAPRQIYTVSVGFMLPEGREQFNVAIRTALIDRQQKRLTTMLAVGSNLIKDY